MATTKEAKKTKKTENKKTKTKKSGGKEKIFKLLEDKFFEIIESSLKMGVVNFASSKLNEAGTKIKANVEEKFSKYRDKVIFVTLLLSGAIFFTYGLFSLLMYFLDWSIYTNIIFGFILLFVSLFFKKN